MTLEFTAPELQTNEALKGFASNDDLAKAYLDLNTKVSTSDISLIPEDIRRDPNISKYKNLIELSRGVVEANKLIGTIKRPPAKPEDYKFLPPDGLHASLKPGEKFNTYFAQMAYKRGLDSETAAELYKDMLGYLSTEFANNDKAEEEKFKLNDTKLHEEWGDKYDEKFNSVKNLLMKIGGQELVDMLGLDKKFGNVPLAVGKFAKVAELLSEDSLKNLGQSELTPHETNMAKLFEQYSEAVRTNDKKHPLMNENDIKHGEAVAMWTKLNTWKASNPG